MATQHRVFQLYHRGTPPKIDVFCSDTFKAETSAVFRSGGPADRKSFANIHLLIDRFANGEQLSNESFPKEGPGFAFKSGRVRFYGAYAKNGTFVLSHAIIKRHDKLRDTDKQKMTDCVAAFERLAEAPAVPT
jgi:hypothetical protein